MSEHLPITIFFQGNSNSRGQASLYTKGPVYSNKNNNKFKWQCENSIETIIGTTEYIDLNEVNFNFSWNPINATQKVFRYFTNMWFKIEGPTHYINPFLMNFAGKNDCETLIKEIENQQKLIRELKPNNKDIVLYGVSRGASTIFTSICKLKNTDFIKLIIIEAPFDRLENVIKKSCWFPKTTQFLINNITNYDPSFSSPLDSIKDFPLDVPIAFVMSEVDTRVPNECTTKLIEELEKRNHKKVHSLMLKISPHSSFSCFDKEDIKNYKNFIFDLYENYLTKK